jgi:hypothetical protein
MKASTFAGVKRSDGRSDRTPRDARLDHRIDVVKREAPSGRRAADTGRAFGPGPRWPGTSPDFPSPNFSDCGAYADKRSRSRTPVAVASCDIG